MYIRKSCSLIPCLLLLIQLLFLISGSAVASEQLANKKIVRLWTYGSTAFVQIDPPGLNTDQCSRSNAYHYVGIDYANGSKEMYATLLTAYIANKTLGFGVSGCMSWGNDTVPKAYRVDVNG